MVVRRELCTRYSEIPFFKSFGLVYVEGLFDHLDCCQSCQPSQEHHLFWLWKLYEQVYNPFNPD